MVDNTSSADPWMESPLDVKENPDIEGPGIVAGFLTSVYLAVFLLLVYYLVEFDPSLDPFRGPGEMTRLPRTNPVDALVHKCKIALYLKGARLWRWVVPKKTSPSSARSLQSSVPKRTMISKSEKFSEVMLNLGDMQIMSGLAFLLGGYFELQNDLSIYHWLFIIRIAWFSTATHLAVLSCLQTYLHRNPSRRFIRLPLMMTVACMLIVGFKPFCWNETEFQLPALPFFGSQGKGNYDNTEPIFSGVFLFSNIFIRLYKTFESPATFTRQIRISIATFSQSCMRYLAVINTGSNRLDLFIYMAISQPCVAVHIVVSTYIHFLASMLMEVWAVCIATTWGTRHLFELIDLRHEAIIFDRNNYPDNERQNPWSFGQVIPLALLLGPLLMIWDNFIGEQFYRMLRSISLRTGKKTLSPPEPSSITRLIPHPENCCPRATTFYITESMGKMALESNRFRRLPLIESWSLCTLSLQPIVSFSRSDTGDKYQPYLGFFERLPWFPFTICQLCIWANIIIFWVFIDITWGPFATWLPFLNPTLGDPGHEAINMLLWILLAGPWSMALFILFWPQRMYSIRVCGGINLNSGGYLHGMATGIPALAIPGATYSFLDSTWLVCILAGCLGLYLIFCFVWVMCQPMRQVTKDEDITTEQAIPAKDHVVAEPLFFNLIEVQRSAEGLRSG